MYFQSPFWRSFQFFAPRNIKSSPFFLTCLWSSSIYITEWAIPIFRYEKHVLRPLLFHHRPHQYSVHPTYWGYCFRPHDRAYLSSILSTFLFNTAPRLCGLRRLNHVVYNLKLYNTWFSNGRGQSRTEWSCKFLSVRDCPLPWLSM